jgi:DnaA-homolog protein
MEQLVLELSRPPAPTLENFAPGSNSEALAALHAWLAGTLHERCIYLCGPSGSGKTHLLRATVHAMQDAGRSVAHVQTSDLETLERVDVLPSAIALDDAHRLPASGQAALFRLFQRLREDEVYLLAAGDLPPSRLVLRADVRTRLGAGLVFQLRLLSDEEKAEALRSHATGRGFTLAPELADYLLRHGRRDLPSLLAVLDALDQHSLQTKRPITLPLLREVLQQAQGATK